jgi:predicted RNA-binding Zn-ribbon protein involved in translation (DUF1610 family)
MVSDFELTYEHYAYTLTKFGMEPQPQEVFDSQGGNLMCRIIYSVIADSIMNRFQQDLAKIENDLAEDDNKIACPHCGSTDWIELTDHEQLYHVARYECEGCGQLFGTANFDIDEDSE